MVTTEIPHARGNQLKIFNGIDRMKSKHKCLETFLL